MRLPRSTIVKIESLRQKTVLNGTTEAEEKAAIAMIEKLETRYNKNKTIDIHLDPKKKMDWDNYAKKIFNEDQYFEYLELTEVLWERYNANIFKIDGIRDDSPITFSEYQDGCKGAFYKIYYESRERIFK